MNLTHHFLIAMPNMVDPNFSRTLTYIAEHSERGALGVIVNRPIDMDLAGLFERVDIPLENPRIAQQPVYFGGPVQTDRGFVLHRPAGQWSATLSVNDEIGMTSSRDILEALAKDTPAQDVLVSLGYSGWGAGQLENEIAENGWLTCPATPDMLFDGDIDGKYEQILAAIGIDLTHLSSVAGHA